MLDDRQVLQRRRRTIQIERTGGIAAEGRVGERREGEVERDGMGIPVGKLSLVSKAMILFSF